MSRIRLGTIVGLSMSLAMFSYAQQPAQDSGPRSQEEPNKQREVGPPPQQPELSPPRGQEETKPPKAPPEMKPPKAEKQETPNRSQEQESKPAREQHGKLSQQRQARPTDKGAHIPDPKFKADFGRQHAFSVDRVISTTTVVPNQTRFIFAGYTFILLDPWPVDWLLAVSSCARPRVKSRLLDACKRCT